MLRSSVGGVPLECVLYNASGPRSGTVEALSKVGESRAGAILSKSATLVKQDGNPLPRIINKISLGPSLGEGSVNSEGLPNAGIDYYVSRDTISELSKFGKPYIVSLSGLSLKDNLEMLTRAFSADGVAAIELNLACPNVPGKPVIAYDFEQMEQVLTAVSALPLFGTKPLGVKLAPYFDMPHFEKAVEIICKFKIQYVVSINTIGNALFVDADNECAMIAPKGGFGGLGGGYVKQTALANVRMISKLLADKGRSDIDVVGVGGVSSGRDAFEMILCGARAVQIGTCHWTEGASCFNRIASELEEFMISKGYSSIEEFRGKLKPYEKGTKSKATTKTTDTETTNYKSSNADIIPHLYAIIIVLVAIIAFLVADKVGIIQSFK